MFRFRKLMLALLIMLLGVQMVAAQETVITEEGVIEDGNDTVEFDFDMEEDQVVVINVEATSEELDPIVALFDPDGDQVAENDDRSPRDLNSRIIYQANDSGSFTAVVSSFGESTGSFAITIMIGDENLEDNPFGENSLVFEGEIEDGSDVQAFEIELADAQTVFIETEATSGDLDTLLTLYDPGDRPVSENDDSSPQTLNSAIALTVDEAGTYTIVVSSYGSTTGEFILIVNSGASAIEMANNVENQTEIYDGTIVDEDDEVVFSFPLDAGQTILVQTEAEDDELDTVLSVYDPSGELLQENDDLNTNTLNSAVAFTAEESGEYTVVVTSYGGDSTGDFELQVTYGGEELIAQLVSAKRLELSGPVLVRQTEHFMIHYTLEGEDATSEEWIDELAVMVEEVYEIEIEDLGWPAPPPDDDSFYDVYVGNLLDDGIFGFARPEPPAGDNPNSSEIEEFAATSFLVVDNDMAEYPGNVDPLDLLLTTVAHEYHHAIQFGYDFNDRHVWYYEATATWMETQAAGRNQDATSYSPGNFQFPEVCFGTKENNFVYGHWMFIQSLVDAYGEDVVLEMWRNVAVYDGFEALEVTLDEYDEDVPTALGRYVVQNLVLMYDLADEIDATVWIENTIDDTGDWTFNGEGVQELAANYYIFDLDELDEEVYNASFSDDDSGELIMYAVGIDGDDADVTYLGDGGDFETDGYDNFYIVVFNPVYDDNVDRCEYYDYEIEIDEGDDALDVTFTLDASEFVEPRDRN